MRNETGDISSQVQQGMQLNGGLGGATRCPVEQTQTGTQLNRGAVQGVDVAGNIDIKLELILHA